jgi:hypothetical protein
MKGYFSEETLKQFSQLAGETFGTDFSESGTYDFTRCVRPDGSAYGTNGKCRKGTEGEKKVEAAKPKKAAKELKDSGSLTRVAKVVKEKAAKKAEPAPATDKAKSVADIKKAQEDYTKLLKRQIELSTSGKMDEALKMGPKVKAALDKWKKMDEDKKSPEQKAAERRYADDMVTFRKKQAERDEAQLAAKLNPTQVKALKDYTNEATKSRPRRSYNDMNQCLRFPNTCKNNAETEKFAKELDSAVRKLPSNSAGDPFYRGIAANRGGAAEFYKTLENAKPGSKIKDPGFGSYSSDRRQAQNFMNDPDSKKKNILFVSRNKGLTPINKFSEMPDENEAILPRGSAQTIRSVRKDGNTLIVELD